MTRRVFARGNLKSELEGSDRGQPSGVEPHPCWSSALLIDGDLRDPSLHKLFAMPLEDGVCELLRSEIEITDAIRPTNTEGLWLMTAGVCDMDAIHALATDQLQPIFEKLRAEFDFVIIDGAPILGLSDSLSIGQHIDGAILTVLRDHSGVRSIHQASELLKNWASGYSVASSTACRSRPIAASLGFSDIPERQSVCPPRKRKAESRKRRES